MSTGDIIWDSKVEAAKLVGRYRVEKFYSDYRDAFWEQKSHHKTKTSAIIAAENAVSQHGGHWRVRDAGA